MFVIAQISDTHIKPEGRLAYDRVDTAAALATCVAAINRLDPKPDLVLATGDLVDAGRRDEYDRLRSLLAPLDMPVYLIPGNHDDRDAMRAVFPDHRYLGSEGFIQYAVENLPIRLLALDTLIPGKGGGELCDERLAWLDRTLSAAPERPTIVFLHHPPFRSHIPGMDQFGLAGTVGLNAVIRRHAQVERLLCGHLHRPIEVRFAGTIASTCPSPAHQINLDLRPEGLFGYILEPPGFQLHVHVEGHPLVTHTVPIGDWPGPYPFSFKRPQAS
ncbi:phosphodiesterase [Desertibaculum subflavum]|uniref:phosphodiesterase n=1 Tax=Desertibaculum subflavum TaxID=2268458 RepID=UPI000E6629A1